jgi:hypothetical protein
MCWALLLGRGFLESERNPLFCRRERAEKEKGDCLVARFLRGFSARDARRGAILPARLIGAEEAARPRNTDARTVKYICIDLHRHFSIWPG